MPRATDYTRSLAVLGAQMRYKALREELEMLTREYPEMVEGGGLIDVLGGALDGGGPAPGLPPPQRRGKAAKARAEKHTRLSEAMRKVWATKKATKPAKAAKAAKAAKTKAAKKRSMFTPEQLAKMSERMRQAWRDKRKKGLRLDGKPLDPKRANERMVKATRKGETPGDRAALSALKEADKIRAKYGLPSVQDFPGLPNETLEQLKARHATGKVAAKPRTMSEAGRKAIADGVKKRVAAQRAKKAAEEAEARVPV